MVGPPPLPGPFITSCVIDDITNTPLTIFNLATQGFK